MSPWIMKHISGLTGTHKLVRTHNPNLEKLNGTMEASFSN